MKAANNITLYVGAQPGSSAAMEGAEKDRESRKTIFAGDLNRNQESPLRDRIAEKKAQAQEKAMKAVKEVFHADLKIDEGMEESRQKVKALKEEQIGLRDGLADLDNRLETLEAARENGEIGEDAYREDLEALNQERLVQEQKLGQNQGQIMGENASVRSTRLERLKIHPMVGAFNQADAIMEAAGDEIMGMAIQEGVEHLDQENEKREEQAEEIREEKEQKEELLEKQKEKRKEEETLIEELKPEEFSSLTKSTEDVQKEIEDMLKRMSLLDEDIKGAAVDEAL